MMIAYFATVSEKECGDNCSYRSCPERYMSKLGELNSISQVRPVSGQSLFYPSVNFPLRSGDLLIVHISRQKDLALLVENRKLLEQFRLVLIIGEELFKESRSYHLLNPRYIMTTSQDIGALNKVVGKMADNTAGISGVNNGTGIAAPQPIR